MSKFKLIGRAMRRDVRGKRGGAMGFFLLLAAFALSAAAFFGDGALTVTAAIELQSVSVTPSAPLDTWRTTRPCRAL